MIQCPNCTHKPLYKNGFGHSGNQRYRCSKCRKNFTHVEKLTKLQEKRIKFYTDTESIAYCSWPKENGKYIEEHDFTKPYQIANRHKRKTWPPIKKILPIGS